MSQMIDHTFSGAEVTEITRLKTGIMFLSGAMSHR
jgi:hypothetical protein